MSALDVNHDGALAHLELAAAVGAYRLAQPQDPIFQAPMPPLPLARHPEHGPDGPGRDPCQPHLPNPVSSLSVALTWSRAEWVGAPLW